MLLIVWMKEWKRLKAFWNLKYNIYIFPGRPFVQFVMSDVGHVYITTPPHPAPDDCLLAEEKLVLIFYPSIH